MAFQVAGLVRRVAVRPGLRLSSHVSISSVVQLVPRDTAGSELGVPLSVLALGHGRGFATTAVCPGLAARGLEGLAPGPTKIWPHAAAIGAVQTRGMGYKSSRRKSKSNGRDPPLTTAAASPPQ